MELRVLRYFLAVAREESISDAAEFLHITQPTLSRQLMDLEEELGKQLLIRGKRNRKIMLTEDGMRLRKRAEEIVALADKTEAEFLAGDDAVSGDVYIGCGESDAMRITKATPCALLPKLPLNCGRITRTSIFIYTAATPKTCRNAWKKGCWISAFLSRRQTSTNTII